MGLFEIDDPGIDVEALEKRVRAAIAAKRGVRFSDEELDELRAAELRPRLRREDLPRGFVDELAKARSHLPEVPPPPAARGFGFEQAPVELYTSGAGGAKGLLLRLLRRLARPFYRATLNLDWELMRLRGDQATLAQGINDLVGPINQQGAWAGRQLSDMTGQLERRHERDLHLLHNLVLEVTTLRLQQTHMQDRINELIRQIDALKERGRALEALAVPGAEAPVEGEEG